MNELRNKNGQTEKEFLNSYDPSCFERPSVTVDMVIFTVSEEPVANYRKLPEKRLRVLLVKRGEHPYLGKWALPGGFIKMNENFEDTVARELKEETNIENVYMEQLYTWGDVKRDPRTRVISVAYMALIDSSTHHIVGGSDAVDAKWFSISSQVIKEEKFFAETTIVSKKIVKLLLKNGEDEIVSHVEITKSIKGKMVKETYGVMDQELAFDHAKIILFGLHYLQDKVEQSAIVFNLMPEVFTLTELQKVYEVILDRELLTANFRRKTAHLVQETNEIKRDKEAGHRPSKLYRFNPDSIMEKSK